METSQLHTVFDIVALKISRSSAKLGCELKIKNILYVIGYR
jgi:hypothetical protein